MANALTIFRIILIIPFSIVFYMDVPWNTAAALAIFLTASFTDFLDGYIARRLRQTSVLGAVLDPVADKMLVCVSLILLVDAGTISSTAVAAALVIVSREIFIAGLREAVAGQGHRLPVTRTAQWKTSFQMIATGLLIASAGNTPVAGIHPYAVALLWLSAVLAFWTGIQYTVRAVRILNPRHAGRHRPPDSGRT